MHWDIIAIYTVKLLLLPPGINLLLILLAFWVGRWSRALSIALFSLSLVTLYAFSTPFVAQGLMSQLQPTTALRLSLQAADQKDTAIVVLAGGRRNAAPEFDDIDTVSPRTLERLRYAARLQRQTHLPVLLSGGKVFGESTAEAVLMNDSFISDFRGAPHWLETKSRNTRENAEYSAKILKENNISTIYLVTDATHMPRAQYWFEQHSLKVIPAPTGFNRDGSGNIGPLAWVPNARALEMSSNVLHERLGLLWATITG